MSNRPGHKALYFKRGTRYYHIALGKDLLGDWVVTCVNGSLDSRLGRIRHRGYASYETASQQFAAMTEYREKRRRYDVIRL